MQPNGKNYAGPFTFLHLPSTGLVRVIKARHSVFNQLIVLKLII